MQITEEMIRNIVAANSSNPYVDVTPYELGFGIPETKYQNFFPQKNEVVVYAAPAQTFKDKEQVVGYSRGSSGASIRVAKGLSVHTGGGSSRAIRQEVRSTNNGDFIITNKRILFVGKDDSFEFKIDNISTVKPLDQMSLLIQSGRSSKNILFDRFSIKYALGLINYVLKANSSGENVFEVVSNANSQMTPEQKQLCEYARNECSKLDPSKVIPKTTAEKKVEKRAARYKRQATVAKVLGIILAAVVVIGIIFIIAIS